MRSSSAGAWRSSWRRGFGGQRGIPAGRARSARAYQRGETSRLEPARAELQLLRAERARRRAQRRPRHRLARAGARRRRCRSATRRMAGSEGGTRRGGSRPVRSRLVLALVAVVALIGAVLAIRSGSSGVDRQSDDAEAPIVAPSRVVSVEGESRVALDSAEIAAHRAHHGGARRGRSRIGTPPHGSGGARSRSEPRRCGRRWPADSRPPKGARGPRSASESRRAPRWAGYRMRSRSRVPMSAVVTGVGARPGEIVEAGQMLLELADNSRPVVRIAWPGDAGRAPRPGHAGAVRRRCPGRSFPHRTRGRSRPLTRLPAYLYRADHPMAGRGARHPGRRGAAGRRTEVARRPGARRRGGAVGGLRLDVRPPRCR